MNNTSPGAHSVFLVSGGARGITAQCVIGLAQRFGCRFILLGRSSLDQAVPHWFEPAHGEAAIKQRIATEITARGQHATPTAIRKLFDAMAAAVEIRSTLDRIADAGGRAEYIAVDICDGVALRNVLARVAPGTVSGVIHGAGALADKRIEHKSAADFEAVYRPKIDGLENMLRCIQADQLRHLVLFSSAAAFFGNIGQADYALANEILNKAAFEWKRRYPGCKVLTINWGPWDGGMVTTAIKSQFAERGIDLIPPDAGVRMLVEQLTCGSDSALQLLAGSPIRSAPTPRPVQPGPRYVRRRLSLAANPFLRDHVIGGQPVLPITCAMQWMSDTCERLCPGYRAFRWAGVQVLKGIVFDETLADSYRMECRELHGDETDDERCFDVVLAGASRTGQTRYHYRARLSLRLSIPPPPVFHDFDLAENGALEGATLYADGTLFHGASFRGIQRVLNLDAGRVTMRCLLPAVDLSTQGQFRVGTMNPFITDVAFQALLIAARRLRGSASLPLACERGELYRPLGFDQPFYVTMLLHGSSEHEMSADVVAHDADGRVYMQVFGENVILSRRLNQLFGAAPAAA